MHTAKELPVSGSCQFCPISCACDERQRKEKTFRMGMPQHDNQDPEQNIPETPRHATKPQISKRRQLVYRCGIAILAVLLLIALVSFGVISVASGINHVNVQQRPISDVL